MPGHLSLAAQTLTVGITDGAAAQASQGTSECVPIVWGKRPKPKI